MTFSLQGTAGRSGLRACCINFGRVRTSIIENHIPLDTPPASPEEAAEEIFACISGRRRGKEGRMYPFVPYETQGRSSTTT